MGDFLLIFMVVLLAVVAAVCGIILLMPGALKWDAWPYAQRRFALRGNRALRE